MKTTLAIILFPIILIAQTNTPPLIVADTIYGEYATGQYLHWTNGIIYGAKYYFYIKNIGGDGVTNVKVTSGSLSLDTNLEVRGYSIDTLICTCEAHTYVSPIPNPTAHCDVTVAFPGDTLTQRYYDNVYPTKMDSAEIVWSSNLTSVKYTSTGLPSQFLLQQNYPNPFNPTTTINYQLPANSHVTLKVYDVLGKEVATMVSENESAGYKSVTFDASNLPSGVYIYRLQAGTFMETKKLTVLK